MRFAFMVILASMIIVALAGAETAAEETRFDYDRMRQDELMQIVETLKSQIGTLEKNREKYRRGVDREYGEIQKKIDELEAERSAANKTWLEKWEKND